MNGTVELKNGYLRLRRYRQEDAAFLYERIGKNGDIADYTGWNPFASPEIAEKNVRDHLMNYADSHYYAWVIEYNGEIVGTIGAYDYDYAEGSLEIGYSIIPEFRGQGLATRAVKTVMKYMFETEKIRTVRAWCAAGNLASTRVLEKAGMKITQTKKQEDDPEHMIFDINIYTAEGYGGYYGR